jgi:hypothetical protein
MQLARVVTHEIMGLDPLLGGGGVSLLTRELAADKDL